jgi:hypothetical protein
VIGRLNYPLKTLWSINVDTSTVVLNDAELVLRDTVAFFCCA